jgi:hypothetical protein
LLRWFERVWFAPLERWDVEYYMRIATTGYQVSDGTMQFHPLYPALARPLVWLGADPLVALALLASFASVLLILAFHRLACLRLEPPDAEFATLCLILSPFAFAVMVPYSEALFLLCAVLCLYWAKTGLWWQSGVAGVLATLTRQQGLFLVVPLLWMVLTDKPPALRGGNPTTNRPLEFGSGWLAVFAVPLAYVGWLIYRAGAFGDQHWNPASLHDLIYSVLISPSAVEVVRVQAFLWPWDALARAVTKLVTSPDYGIVTNLVGGLWFVGMLAASWRYLDASDRVYTVAIALVSFSYHTGPIHPYMGLLRHLLLAYPLFLGLGQALSSRATRMSYLALSFSAQMFLLLSYGLRLWIP